MKLVLVLLVILAGVMYLNYPEPEIAYEVGEAVFDYIKQIVLPKPEPPKSYLELLLMRIGYLEVVEETPYFSWAIDGYIYLAILVTFGVYVLYGISMLYLVEWPSKVSNEPISNINNNDAEPQQDIKDDNDIDDKQQRINDDKACSEIIKQLETYKSIVAQLTEKQTDLEDLSKQQAELLSRAQEHVKGLEKERLFYWVGFVCMFVLVLADIMYNVYSQL